MIRLHLVVEGKSEEVFARNVLTPYLAPKEIYVSVHQVTTRRRRNKVYRGGGRKYAPWKKDLELWIREDTSPDAYFSSIVDLYALPKDFPGYKSASGISDPYDRVRRLEKALAEDIGSPRFVPNILLHEFEALLLADPKEFLHGFIGQVAAVGRLRETVSSFESPELIDDGEKTAPSKRIIAEIPEYEGRKSSAGPLIAARIGVDRIREKCPHFKEWLDKLERLA